MTIDQQLNDILRKIRNITDKNECCIICGHPLGNNQIDLCHFIKKSQSTFLKYYLPNVSLGHRWCNMEEEKNNDLYLEHANNVRLRFGDQVYFDLTSMKRKIIKFGTSEKKECLADLKEILKKLKTSKNE